MTAAAGLIESLRGHLSLCREILDLTEREAAALRNGEGQWDPERTQTRKSLLDRLVMSLDRIRDSNRHWRELSDEERADIPEVSELLRENQDMVMRIIVLDRENERRLLGMGMIPAANLPSAQRQRPHFVADLYRRNRAD